MLQVAVGQRGSLALKSRMSICTTKHNSQYYKHQQEKKLIFALAKVGISHFQFQEKKVTEIESLMITTVGLSDFVCFSFLLESNTVGPNVT